MVCLAQDFAPWWERQATMLGENVSAWQEPAVPSPYPPASLTAPLRMLERIYIQPFYYPFMAR